MAAAESRLASLTTAQTRALQSHCEQWQRLATSAGPTDKAAAERALARLYTGAGLDLPEVRWFPSPIQMLKANASKSGVLAGDNVWHSIGGLLGDRVWRTLWRYVDAKLGHDVWQALDGSLWTKVTRSAGSNTLWTKAPYDGLPEPRERGAFGVIQHPGRVELLACQALEYEWGRTGGVLHRRMLGERDVADVRLLPRGRRHRRAQRNWASDCPRGCCRPLGRPRESGVDQRTPNPVRARRARPAPIQRMAPRLPTPPTSSCSAGRGSASLEMSSRSRRSSRSGRSAGRQTSRCVEQ